MKSNNDLFTCLFEYKSQKYISQIKAKSQDEAKVQWAKKIVSQSTVSWNEKEKSQLLADIPNIPLQVNTPHINVWNLEVKLGKKKGIVYCIKTKESPLS